MMTTTSETNSPLYLAGIPLFADYDTTAKLFGMSATTLRRLERANRAGFPAKRIGAHVIINIPRFYAWLDEYKGGNEE